MESDIAANSDIFEPVQEFSAYVSPSPPDPSEWERLGLEGLEAAIEETTREFGACRLVPGDGRIKLSFDLDIPRLTRRPGRFTRSTFRFLMKKLKQVSMTKNKHFQFEILDSNLANPAKPILACYEPKEENVTLFETTSTQISGYCSQMARWSMEKNYMVPRPFIGSKSANPYRDRDNGFHIVFYEKIVKIPGSESWKTGRLYQKIPKGEVEAFRRSAFTMFTKSESRNDSQEEESELCWTILLLTPSGFFQSHEFIDDSLKLSSDPDIRDIAIQRCMLTAELTSILYAMRLVVKRWEELYQHIEGLLHEDFMDPATYVELLFDDENFSQSRLYFWVIGCVNEFQISIEDNIKQWTLFREARVESYLERNQVDVSRDDSFSTSSEMKMGKQKKVPGEAEEIDIELPFRNANVPNESRSSASFDNLREDSPKKIKNLAKKIDAEVESLINCQSQFKHQQETAQAFRDGLFNASALMESRASTRLGENVKLLTYVSIFYLPLAFCAALWAIPNITSSGTRSPFILTTILVGFVTYMIVFNLGNVVKQWKKLYEPFRSKIIIQMGKQSEPMWEKQTKRFESTFGPKRADREPSEWWIPTYVW
ncbi:hypothetical protein BTUL_0205g00200 [Botrytis tulipae]|uniref:Uncharacterized protein n=1 Tax=Botrytis tulipae TaxID=87230 RepID=A0A4Z1EDJ6_9HELO|nr:hypothetical protein BTUL_0205g00200 [Botrytis tulipae]